MRTLSAGGIKQLPNPFHDASGKSVLRQFLVNSPIFRQTLLDILENLESLPSEKNKTIVFCHNPRTGELLTMVLGRMSIPSLRLRSSDIPDANDKTIEEQFNNGYKLKALSFAGFNMHYKRARVICEEQYFNNATVESTA